MSASIRQPLFYLRSHRRNGIPGVLKISFDKKFKPTSHQQWTVPLKASIISRILQRRWRKRRKWETPAGHIRLHPGDDPLDYPEETPERQGDSGRYATFASQSIADEQWWFSRICEFEWPDQDHLCGTSRPLLSSSNLVWVNGTKKISSHPVWLPALGMIRMISTDCRSKQAKPYEVHRGERWRFQQCFSPI